MRKSERNLYLLGLLFLALTIFSASLALFFLYLRGLPIPIGDQWWDTVHVAALTRQGKLSVNDIFAYSEGHRLANIRIISWLMTILTNYNPIILNSATWLISAGNVVLVYRLLSSLNLSSRRPPIVIRLGALALFSSTLFCISHGQNWIDFYFSQWQLSFFFLFLAANLIVCHRASWINFIALLAAAVLSSLSMGLGLGSWVSIPIMAASRKGYRKTLYLFLWVFAGFLFLYFYFSDYSRFGETSSLDGIKTTNPKDLVFLLGYYLSRKFIIDTGNSIIVKILFIFSLSSLFLFIGLAFLLWKRGFAHVALLWSGIAIYSIIGSLMVFVSRGGVMPSERHSPGSDGFWVAFIGISVSYILVSISLNQEFKINGCGLPKLVSAILVCLWFLGTGRSLASFRQRGDWRSPTYFSRSCIESTRLHPLYRNHEFRSCFMFGDERSTYQLALMGLGNLKPKDDQLPLINDVGLKTFAILPSRLMSAYADQFILRKHSQKNELNSPERFYYSPAEEKPLSRLWPSPLTQHMNWNDLGKGQKTPGKVARLEELFDKIDQLNPQSDSLLLIAGKEMIPESQRLISHLKSAGFIESPTTSLDQLNHLFPSMAVKCFVGFNSQSKPFNPQPCDGPKLVRLPSSPPPVRKL
jgi:hypothetical protein